jgi:protein-S-isoprenylcysteine O-methyltransferase Ste14
MVAGLAALAVTRNLFSSQPLLIALQVASLLLFLWARITFGRRSFHPVANPTEGGLVTAGPYQYIRHPIYAAASLFVIAGAAGNWSWSAGLYGGLILVSAVVRIWCEEVLVTARYPEYAAYKARTRRMIPFVY